GDIAHAVRQRFPVRLNLFDDAVFVFERLHAQRFTLHRFAIYMQQAVDHLDTIARHANDALDEVAIRLRLRAEYDHVATLWLAAEEAAMRQQPFKRCERITAVAVRPLGHDDIVADLKRRLHRSRGNAKRLRNGETQHHGERERVEDGLHVIPEDVHRRRRRTRRRHAHAFLANDPSAAVAVLTGPPPARPCVSPLARIIRRVWAESAPTPPK